MFRLLAGRSIACARRAPIRIAPRAQSLRKRLLTTQARPEWDQMLAAADGGQAAAQCDVGWAFHQGMAPGGQDISKAVEQYELAASQGYPPAASLLADLHYLGHDLPVNHSEVQRTTRTTVCMSDYSPLSPNISRWQV